MSKIEVNTVDVQCGSTLTLGSSGKTVAIATGASTTGMGRSGTVDWCSTIYTNSPGTITGVNGKGYFINTTSGAVTVTLPSSPSVGDIIAVKDYARTFVCNPVTLNRNGSNMCGNAANTTLSTSGSSTTLIYADSTKGWLTIQESTTTTLGQAFISATGGSVTTCGNFKIHTFNSDANFVVSSVGNSAGSNTVSYMVVAGGGGTSNDRSGGGGAGGYRESKALTDSYTASPLNATSGPTYNLPVSAQTYPITIGAGGAADTSSPFGDGGDGTNSVFSTITSAGGGGGARNNCEPAGTDGGSGGGAGSIAPHTGRSGGAGNVPPVSPPQGNPGGNSQNTSPGYSTGGGGGAGASGGNASGTQAGDGGAGVSSEISGSSVARAGGGGGGSDVACKGGAAGTGGGGAGGTPPSAAVAGTANTGGGAGATSGGSSGVTGRAGGSGVVIIRYKFQ